MQRVNVENRLAAAIVAIVLGIWGPGSLGIHKFILGYKKQGIQCLIWTGICLILIPVTCGASAVGIIVLSWFGVAEGIVLLLKTDSQLEQEAASGKYWL